MSTMKAVRIHAYGGPEVLVYEDADVPSPGQSEVLVRVQAAGVNPVDWKVREGYLKNWLNHALPLTLGWDFSGTVEAAGPGTERLKVGDEVMSRPDLARNGAYAQYIVVREQEAALKPRSMDHIQAAGLSLAGLTAWQYLFDTAHLGPGQRVLIHGAAGGVGSLAVQLAKWKGLFVIGTASARNQDFIRELGVDQAIDYQAQPFEKLAKDLDAVLDTLGGETQERSWGLIKPGGYMLSTVSLPPEELTAARGLRQGHFSVRPNAQELAEIAELVDAGKLKVVVDKVLPLAEARQAQQLSQAGHTRGKIVLKVD